MVAEKKEVHHCIVCKNYENLFCKKFGAFMTSLSALEEGCKEFKIKEKS
jgi:hypothetical protein